jgi:hypothetical protein
MEAIYDDVDKPIDDVRPARAGPNVQRPQRLGLGDQR